MPSTEYGLWRSLVARCVRDAEVLGSNPGSPTTEVAAQPGLTPRLLRIPVVTADRTRPWDDRYPLPMASTSGACQPL
jgi:hypothetical protein